MICINCLKEATSLPVNQLGEVLCTKKCKDEYKEWWKAFKAKHRKIAREEAVEAEKKEKLRLKIEEDIKEQNRILTEQRLAKEAAKEYRKSKSKK